MQYQDRITPWALERWHPKTKQSDKKRKEIVRNKEKTVTLLYTIRLLIWQLMLGNFPKAEEK